MLNALMEVSIHAPTWGATDILSPFLSLRQCFNSRTHVGCDSKNRQNISHILPLLAALSLYFILLSYLTTLLSIPSYLVSRCESPGYFLSAFDPHRTCPLFVNHYTYRLREFSFLQLHIEGALLKISCGMECLVDLRELAVPEFGIVAEYVQSYHIHTCLG